MKISYKMHERQLGRGCFIHAERFIKKFSYTSE